MIVACPRVSWLEETRWTLSRQALPTARAAPASVMPLRAVTSRLLLLGTELVAPVISSSLHESEPNMNNRPESAMRALSAMEAIRSAASWTSRVASSPPMSVLTHPGSINSTAIS